MELYIPARTAIILKETKEATEVLEEAVNPNEAPGEAAAPAAEAPKKTHKPRTKKVTAEGEEAAKPARKRTTKKAAAEGEEAPKKTTRKRTTKKAVEAPAETPVEE